MEVVLCILTARDVYKRQGEYKEGGLNWDDPSAEMADKYIEHVFGPQGSLLWNEANAVSLQIYAAYANYQDKVNSDFRA